MKKILHLLGIHDWGKWEMKDVTFYGGIFGHGAKREGHMQIRECKQCGLKESRGV